MLLSGEEPLGVIAAFYDLPRAFSSDEIELMRTFTVQAALAINNARLYARTDSALNQRIDQLQALYDIGQELTSTLNLQKVFDLVVKRALEGTRSTSGMIVVGSEDNLSLQVVARRGYPDGLVETPLDLNTGLTATVFDSGRPMLIADTTDQAQYVPLNPVSRSLLSVPIRRDEETLGVITIEGAQPNAFGDGDVTFVTQIATHAAIAIENARLFKRIGEGRDRMQAILDSMNEGVLLIDRDGGVALANPPIATLLNLKPDLLVGQLADDLLQDIGALFAERMGFTSGDLRLLLADLRAGQLTAESLIQYSYALTEPRETFLNRQVTPVRDERGDLLGLLLVFLNETEQQEIARTREDLSRMIVHDLRSPLTALKGGLNVIRELIDIPEERPSIDELLRIAEDSADGLLKLVSSLLDVARMESGAVPLELAAVSLHEPVGQSVALLEVLAREAGVTLHQGLPDDLPLLRIDVAQIRRVMTNLLDNALRYTPGGGHVYVEAAVDDAAHQVTVTVRDTGPGIPPDMRKRIFERFATEVTGQPRRGPRGLGLGLTFCRLAVEAHGGRIWVEDGLNGGAAFCFTLPISTEPSMMQTAVTLDQD
jgi:signal transduction histidine kinase